MRIISKFKDYYDSSIGYGIDPGIVYKRVDQAYQLAHLPRHEAQIVKDVRAAILTPDRIAGELFDHVYVGFCGKIYGGLAYHVGAEGPNVPVSKRTYWDGHFRHYETSWQFAWAERDVDPEELVKERRLPGRYGFKQCETMQEWFTRNRHLRVQSNTDIFTKYGIVSFILHNGQLITDGVLSSVRFQRVLDNFTAFQEISMFISGVLGTFDEVAPEPITDELRAHTKGFDKRSFRRDPTKKKRG